MINRINLKLHTHSQNEALTPANKRYRKWIEKFTIEELKSDLGKGDITTNAFFAAKKRAAAVVVAKESGILAGRQEADYFLRKRKKVKFSFAKKDGEPLKKNEIILRLSGDVRELMIIERVLLNVLGRMSGIAAYTNQIAKKAKSAVPNILITPTRKTLWGWLDKRACVIGGGGTHRLSLDDAILIKHNHLKASGVKIEDFLKKTLKRAKGRFIEIEVRNSKDALKAALVFAEAKEKGFPLPCVIMFDNMSPDEISKTIRLMKKNKIYNQILLEASGGIKESNLKAYAKTGVDILSLGILTYKAPMLDMSFRVVIARSEATKQSHGHRDNHGIASLRSQ